MTLAAIEDLTGIERLELTDVQRRRALNVDDLWIGDTLVWKHKRRKPVDGPEFRCLRIKQMWRGDRLAHCITADGARHTFTFTELKRNYRKAGGVNA